MAKKTFKDKINPTMNFISQESIDKVEQAPAEELEPVRPSRTRKAPEGYKLNPEYIELRNRRVQILVQPSVYSAVKARAQAEGISVNEVINNAIEEYIER